MRYEHPVAWLWSLADCLLKSHATSHPHAGLFHCLPAQAFQREWVRELVDASDHRLSETRVNADRFPLTLPLVANYFLEPSLDEWRRRNPLDPRIAAWTAVIECWDL